MMLKKTYLTGASSDLRRAKKYRPFIAQWCLVVAILSPLNSQPIEKPILFHKKFAAIKSITLLPVKFDCYHLSASGFRVYDDSMSLSARSQITGQIVKILSDRRFVVTTSPEDSATVNRWRPVRNLYSVVNYQIINRIYGTPQFPSAVQKFAYTITPLTDSLMEGQFDAALFIDGFDDGATKKRKVRTTVAGILSAVTIMAGVAAGGVGGVVMVAPQDVTYATCALVNRQGEIVWYYQLAKTGTVDMADERDAGVFLAGLLQGFEHGSKSP